jgi:hypothetical protein
MLHLSIDNLTGAFLSGPEQSLALLLKMTNTALKKINITQWAVLAILDSVPQQKTQTLYWILINNVQFEFNQYFIFREKSVYSFSHMILC